MDFVGKEKFFNFAAPIGSFMGCDRSFVAIDGRDRCVCMIVDEVAPILSNFSTRFCNFLMHNSVCAWGG